ncbi:hypothetical protein DAPPUDRAFT_236362 [Daphnia pulex]|uniref:Uncharacterized protein n=1 Tax=Daphnia pulex TaxID=6669 RepID=E9G1U3_DAPPU|nr:hypothetical protein DAPPUDRAFT_236362 [Daphnia pulex]|eukprot:EFX86752.1 hypothetical protein DAPPUDRAFT_236362 [Daphnia pulex]
MLRKNQPSDIHQKVDPTLLLAYSFKPALVFLLLLAMEVQARGGGSYGGGYGASEYGNDYVDPYVVLASLGFGVFLFNIIYNLLNRSVRSVQISDMNLPLQLSDRPEEFHNMLDNITHHNYLVKSY